MNKIKDPNIEEQYNELKGMSLPDLCFKIAAQTEGSAPYRLAKFVYEEKQMADQLKWIKCSAILTAIATLSAAIAGALLAHMLHISEPKIMQPNDKQQNIQQKSEASPDLNFPVTNPLPDSKKPEPKK